MSIVYPHPCDIDRPLFFMFDSVHILKCVRNNWLNQKSNDKLIVYPFFEFDDIKTEGLSDNNASFNSLKQLHAVENGSLVKFAYRLSLKALNLTSIERQNVKLALQVINNGVAEALLHLGEKFNIFEYYYTSMFIKIFWTWWQVVNVKTPLKGQRLRNVYQQPITATTSDAKKFLIYFLQWLDRWKITAAGGKLTRETFTVLSHTTHALLEISDYCLNELGASYVLLGKFQTDALESRFERYRQLSGEKYNVSLRQVYECEKKLRLLSVLRLKLHHKEVDISTFDTDWCQFHDDCNSINTVSVTLTTNDLSAARDYMPVISDYIYSRILLLYCTKKLSCLHCRERVVNSEGNVDNLQNELIKKTSRGGLLYPAVDVVHIVLISYIVINKICDTDEFKGSTCHRNYALKCILSSLEDEEFLFLYKEQCMNARP